MAPPLVRGPWRGASPAAIRSSRMEAAARHRSEGKADDPAAGAARSGDVRAARPPAGACAGGFRRSSCGDRSSPPSGLNRWRTHGGSSDQWRTMARRRAEGPFLRHGRHRERHWSGRQWRCRTATAVSSGPVVRRRRRPALPVIACNHLPGNRWTATFMPLPSSAGCRSRRSMTTTAA